MAIPLGQLREALFQARKLGPSVSKATKKTIRVLHNEGNIDSLTSMLKGKSDFNVRATLDDMMHPSSKTSAGYASDGYSAASMAKLPKGTVTNRAGSGAGLARIQSDLAFLKSSPKAASRPAPGNIRARVMTLARNQELGAMASSGKAAHAGQQIDRDILKSALVRARKSGQPGMSLGVKTSVRNMVSNSRVKPGQHPSYVNPTIGDVNAGLDQFAKFGSVAPRRGAEGPRPSSAGQQMIDGITEHATDFKFGDGDAFLPNRVPRGTVSRPSYTGLSSKNKSDIKKVVKAVKTKEATAKSAAFAKRRAILNNMKNRK